MHSPFVSNPAARPTAFGNRIPMTHTGFSGAVGAISAFKPKTVNQSRLFKTRRCALCALRQSSIFLTVAKRIGTHPENRANVSFFLTNKPLFYRIPNSYRTAGWSSLVARRAHNPKVGGSNPSPATKSSELLFGEVFFVSGKSFFYCCGRKRSPFLCRARNINLCFYGSSPAPSLRCQPCESQRVFPEVFRPCVRLSQSNRG